MDDLKDRVALVTGASRGIGAATAEALARAGCNVAIGYNNSRKAAEEVAARIRETGRRVALIPADVSAHAAAETLVGTAEAELGVIQAICESSGCVMQPISWKEMICPVSKVKEGRKVAKPRQIRTV